MIVDLRRLDVPLEEVRVILALPAASPLYVCTAEPARTEAAAVDTDIQPEPADGAQAA